LPLSSGLGELFAQAILPPETGRRYPHITTAPQGLDINGEVLQPSDLPNPYGFKHVDPIERAQLRPLIDTQNGPQWQWRF
jgi:hypothetical protein